MWNGMRENTKQESALLVSPYNHGDCSCEEALCFANGKRSEQFGPTYAIDWFDHIRKGTSLPFPKGVITYYRTFEDKWAHDFYGKETFDAMYDSLSQVDSTTFTMPGYVLKNTLSENGHVARGICIGENGKIKHIREIKKIMRVDGETKYEDNENWVSIDENSLVSMNFWGFTPDVFEYVEECFAEFLNDPNTNIITDEFYIPTVIEYGITHNKFDCRIIKTDAKWMGVTYRSDKPAFQEYLNGMIDNGLYPENLWA
jgi:hypothetical protein